MASREWKQGVRVAAVIAEFNPFHNGHKYLLKEAKNQGFEFVIAVISGNFVQRGEPAVADKFVRAEAALAAGFSMVLELPTRFCLASAQGFAAAAVYCLESTGIVSDLFFGSESGSLKRLETLQTAMQQPGFGAQVKLELKAGVCYPKALESALKKLGPGPSLCKTPNDILALEYLNAVKKLNSKITLHPVKRVGAEHGSEKVEPGFASGCGLRAKLKAEGLAGLAPFVPGEVFEVYEKAAAKGRFGAETRWGQRAVILKLRGLAPGEFEEIAGVSEGLGNRFKKELKTATTLEELTLGVKSKRYVMTRVQRVALCAFLGIKTESQQRPPSYIRVLGQRKDAACLAGWLGRCCRLPVVYNINKAGGKAQQVAEELEWEAKATDSYAVFLPKLGRQGVEYIQKFIAL